MSIRIKFSVYLSSALLIILLLALYAGSIQNQLHDELDDIQSQSYKLLQLTEQLDSSLQKQLLSWSNLLLRGLEPDEYHRYLQDFYQQERDTRTQARRLKDELELYPEARQKVDLFYKSHDQLGIRYREALRIYNQSDDPIYETDRFLWNAVNEPLIQLSNVKNEIINQRQQMIVKAEKSHNEAENTIIVLSLIIALMFIVVSIWFADRNLSGPLSSTIKIAEKISAGDYSRRVSENMPGEFDLLARAFNQMIDKLTSTNRDLLDKMIQLEKEISQRQRIEKELQRKSHDAEAASRAKSEFLSNVSHEIRTPLNVVSGYAELLSLTETTATQRKYVKSIQSGSASLLQIINDVLDLAKIESGKLQIEKSIFSLHEFIADLGDMFRNSADEKSLSFQMHISDNTPVYIIADKDRLKQILMNFLSNAFKFTHQGHVKLEVDAITSNSPHHADIQFSIEDSGIGIPVHFQQKIFNQFEQQDGQDTRKYGGTGLGLAICQKLSQLLNGSIALESVDEQGSTFTLTLFDVEIPDNVDDIDSTEEPPILQLSKARILIADDIQANRELVRNFLNGQPIELLEAENGRRSIDMARQHKPDLILMDIKMPEMDGIEAVRIIKSDDQLKHIPVIALSASSTKGNDIQLNESLFDDYITKPVKLNLLISVLGQFLNN